MLFAPISSTLEGWWGCGAGAAVADLVLCNVAGAFWCGGGWCCVVVESACCPCRVVGASWLVFVRGVGGRGGVAGCCVGCGCGLRLWVVVCVCVPGCASSIPSVHSRLSGKLGSGPGWVQYCRVRGVIVPQRVVGTGLSCARHVWVGDWGWIRVRRCEWWGGWYLGGVCPA